MLRSHVRECIDQVNIMYVRKIFCHVASQLTPDQGHLTFLFSNEASIMTTRRSNTDLILSRLGFKLIMAVSLYIMIILSSFKLSVL